MDAPGGRRAGIRRSLLPGPTPHLPDARDPRGLAPPRAAFPAGALVTRDPLRSGRGGHPRGAAGDGRPADGPQLRSAVAMSEIACDVLVVGSGMSAVHAAQTLVEAGRDVTMVDAGSPDARHSVEVPERDFLWLRENDADQHRYFLGRGFEGVPWGPAANTLTPSRAYIASGTERWSPLRSATFHGLESLAYGGLGNGWGAGCAAYPDVELSEMGLDAPGIRVAYRVIADRIGVAARHDDATPVCSEGLGERQEPLRLDASIARIEAEYAKHRGALRRRGLVVGKDPMAVLTAPGGERGATSYTDMEFWTDHAKAVYRPWMTLDALRAGPHFRYEGGLHVMTVAESEH